MMNLGKYLFGFRPEYLSKADEAEKRNQFFAFNVLAFMLWTLVILATISAVCYGLIIFESWLIALISGLIFGGIFFLLMLLVLFLNMTTQHKDLYEKMTDMETVFDEYRNTDLESISDEKAMLTVTDFAMKLREENTFPDRRSTHGSNLFTSAIKLAMIILISIIVANGMEILIFRDKLNQSMSDIRNSKILLELSSSKSEAVSLNNNPIDEEYSIHANWMLDMVDEKNGNFILVECHSLLLTLKIMSTTLGVWKIIIDVLFTLLFLTPFIVVRRSRFIAGGVFLKEAAILDISISLMFYILTEKKCREIKRKLENEYDYTALLKK